MDKEKSDAELLAISDRLRAQDNRATQHPMFCLQKLVRDVGYVPGYGDGETVWIDMQSGDYEEVAPETEGAEEFGYKDRWETVMVAFTEQGIKDYMCKNGHNVQRVAYNGQTRIYVESFRRCDEMIKIREFLLSGRPDPVAALEQEHKRILRQVIEAWTIRCDAHRGATEAAEARVAALEAEVARLKEQRANLEAERDAAFDALGDYEIDDEPTTHEAGEPGLLKRMVLSLVDQIREGNRRSTALLAGRDELELLIGAMYSATEIYPLTDEEDSRLNDVLQKLRDKAPAAEGGADHRALAEAQKGGAK